MWCENAATESHRRSPHIARSRLDSLSGNEPARPCGPHHWQGSDYALRDRAAAGGKLGQDMNSSLNEHPWSVAGIAKVRHLLLIIVLVISGLACVIASIAWSGCASGAGASHENTAISYPTGPIRAAAPKNHSFKENVLFLKEAHVPVSEVYASFGQPDWESKPLRLIAYRAENNQALIVAYGTDDYVTRYAVRKIAPTDALQEVAPLWLQSN